MSLRRFIKFFLMALGFQVALQVIVSPLLSTLFNEGNFLPDFLDFYVYAPFINAVIAFGGYTGEASMVWPPLLGIVLGVLTYAVMFGLVIAYLTRRPGTDDVEVPAQPTGASGRGLKGARRRMCCVRMLRAVSQSGANTGRS
jgi:hypothetical protein